MNDIYQEINRIIQSDEFINYCDNELLDFASGYVDYIYKNFPAKGRKEKGEVIEFERISLTQARGILNVSAQVLNKTDELKILASNRKSKTTNEYTRPIWEELEKLFDSGMDKWQEITGLNKLSPKQFVENHIPSNLTNNEKKEFLNNLYANLIRIFCIHFYSEYKYQDTLRGGRTKK